MRQTNNHKRTASFHLFLFLFLFLLLFVLLFLFLLFFLLLFYEGIIPPDVDSARTVFLSV